jgi:hypothetical protein
MNDRRADMQQSDTAFERRSRELLLGSADALEGHIRSRLTAARHAALAELEKRAGEPRFRVPGAWLPAGALAAVAAVALAVWIARPVGGPAAVVADATPVEDAELLASNDGPELYADDPDFYEWAGADSGGGAG